MLIDTGAGNTCIALDVAEELQLTMVGLRKGYGAGGIHENKVFEASLRLIASNGLVVNSTHQAAGIPDLGKHLDATQVQTGDDYPKRLIGLLGRDFLLHATLIYRGSQGIIEIQLDMGSFPNQP